MNADIQDLKALLRELAREEILPRYKRTDAAHKADGSLVTAADLAVQRRMREALAERWPELPLLGEEMDHAEQSRLLADPKGSFWCLDPLDGTSNFANGFPGFAISLALIEQGQVRLGLVLDPVRDECFHAERGGGAFVNGEPIGPNTISDQIGECIVMMDLKRIPPERIVKLFAGGGFRSQRNLGAVALEWCWLAGGRFQLYLHGGQRLWDYAAGRLIASEAGVPSRIYIKNGVEPTERWGLDQRLAVAAANEQLLGQWLDWVDLPLVDQDGR